MGGLELTELLPKLLGCQGGKLNNCTSYAFHVHVGHKVEQSRTGSAYLVLLYFPAKY